MLGGGLSACGAQENQGAGSGTPAPFAEPIATSAKPSPKASKTTKKVVTEIRRIPFKQVTVKDASLAKGKTQIRTRGVQGTKRLTFEITYAGGKLLSKHMLRTVVTKRPVTQVRVVGTKVAQPKPTGRGCDPNYTGCVPIASDVDCAGGSGNGPAYVAGPVRVIGIDIYGLDRDKDGIGCED
jgi:hypothetical protein